MLPEEERKTDAQHLINLNLHNYVIVICAVVICAIVKCIAERILFYFQRNGKRDRANR